MDVKFTLLLSLMVLMSVIGAFLLLAYYHKLAIKGYNLPEENKDKIESNHLNLFQNPHPQILYLKNNENDLGFWNIKLKSMKSNKNFNVDWNYYEKIAKSAFNLRNTDFNWEIIDRRFYKFFEDDDESLNKTTIHEFQILKKDYYDWQNKIKTNKKFYSIKLEEVMKNTIFVDSVDLKILKDNARKISKSGLNNEISWNDIDHKLEVYLGSKTRLYQNKNFRLNKYYENLINLSFGIKKKYSDYLNSLKKIIPLKNKGGNSKNVEIISKGDFSKLNKKQIEILKKKKAKTNSENVNNENSTVKRNSTRDIMSDIGNNIQEGTEPITMFSKLQKIENGYCQDQCVHQCEMGYLRTLRKQSLFNCVSLNCFCDEMEYNQKNKLKLKKDNFIYSSKNFRYVVFFLTMIIIFVVLAFIIAECGCKFSRRIDNDEMKNIIDHKYDSVQKNEF